MPKDNARLGILMMIGFCALAPASDALVKILGDTIPLLQVLIARFIAQLLLLRGNLWTSRHNTWMRRDRIGLVILRSILHLVAIACLFLSLRYLPLADAIAIAYVLPFLVLGVGWFTGDRASPLTLALCLLGFFGTLMVVQPSFAEVGWPALLPVLVAVLFTGFMFITRKVSKYIDPVDLQAANGICAMAILLPIAFFGSLWLAYLQRPTKRAGCRWHRYHDLCRPFGRPLQQTFSPVKRPKRHPNTARVIWPVGRGHQLLG